MPQLDPTWFASQIFWLVISFAALYFVLARWALPRLSTVLAIRKQTVDDDVSAADGMTLEAERARKEYERSLSEARARAQALLTEALAEQKTRAEASARVMDAEVAAKLSEAEKRIGAMKQQLLQTLIPASTELAELVVEKLTNSKPSNGDTESQADSDLKMRSR